MENNNLENDKNYQGPESFPVEEGTTEKATDENKEE